MHGLQLGVVSVELPQRPDREKFPVPAAAEERDSRVQESTGIQRVDVLGRAVRISELQVALQKLADIRRSRIINRDSAGTHSRSLRGFGGR